VVSIAQFDVPGAAQQSCAVHPPLVRQLDSGPNACTPSQQMHPHDCATLEALAHVSLVGFGKGSSPQNTDCTGTCTVPDTLPWKLLA
jgi:hypothetical protein